MRRGICSLLVIACVASQGCSLVTVQRPNAEGQFEGKCTTDKDMPWWDAIIGGAEGALGLGVTVSAISGGGNATSKGLLAAILLGSALAHGYSAHRGFQWVEQCRKSQGLGDGEAPPSSDPSKL